jgi:hypothetical protein
MEELMSANFGKSSEIDGPADVSSELFGMEFRDLGAWESIPGFETLSGKCSEARKSVLKPGMDFTLPGLGTLS